MWNVKKIEEDPDDTGMCSKCGAAETQIRENNIQGTTR